jgi:hypothetical protein
MSIENHAKAIAAGIIATVAPALLLVLIGAPPVPHFKGAVIVGGFSGLLTAAAVWWVPNRTHGFNVAEIAAVLVKAGFEASEREGDRA